MTIRPASFWGLFSSFFNKIVNFSVARVLRAKWIKWRRSLYSRAFAKAYITYWCFDIAILRPVVPTTYAIFLTRPSCRTLSYKPVAPTTIPYSSRRQRTQFQTHFCRLPPRQSPCSNRAGSGNRICFGIDSPRRMIRPWWTGRYPRGWNRSALVGKKESEEVTHIEITTCEGHCKP